AERLAHAWRGVKGIQSRGLGFLGRQFEQEAAVLNIDHKEDLSKKFPSSDKIIIVIVTSNGNFSSLPAKSFDLWSWTHSLRVTTAAKAQNVVHLNPYIDEIGYDAKALGTCKGW